MSSGGAYEPIATGPERRAAWRRRVAAMAVLGCLMVAPVVAVVNPFKKSSSFDEAAATTDDAAPPVTTDDAAPPVTADDDSTSSWEMSWGRISQKDMLDNEAACKWISLKEGVDCKELEPATLSKYLPTNMTFAVNQALAQGKVGSEVTASSGYIVFNMVHYADGADVITASWIVVTSLGGELYAMVPLEYENGLLFAMGLKFWDGETLLFTAGANSTLSGYTFVCLFSDGIFYKLSPAVVNVQDVQRASSAKTAIWAMTPDDEIEQIDVLNGNVSLGPYSGATAQLSDPNHIQVAYDADGHIDFGIISSHDTNSVVKVNGRGDIIYVLGGENATISLADADEPWIGQYNAEFIGNDEIALFDNHWAEDGVDYNSPSFTNRSRLVIVHVDEKDSTAHISWSYPVGAYSETYGDCDQLPSGNLLASWWPTGYVTLSDPYSARIQEITRATQEVAFDLSIYDNTTADLSACNNDTGLCAVNSGWLMYSVERFYIEPLVYNMVCADGNLTFTTQDTYKRPWYESGLYMVTAPTVSSPVAEGTFLFEPFWNPTNVTVAGVSTSGSVTVTNVDGSSSTVEFTC